MSQASPLRNLPAVKAATSAASAAPAFDTKKALAIGGAALLAAIAAYFLLREKKSSAVSASTAAAVEEPSVTKPAKGKIEESVEEEEVEDESEEEEVVRVGAGGECTKEVLLQILGEMHRKIVDLQGRLRELAESMEPQQLLAAHNEGIQSIEAHLYAKYGLSDEQVAAAHQRFDHDEEVSAALQKIRSMFESGAPDMSTIPADMTVEKFIEKFKIQVDMTEKASEECFNDAKRLGLAGLDAVGAYEQMLMERLSEVEEQSLELMGMSQEAFLACWIQYRTKDPRIEVMSKGMQLKQEERKMKLMMGGR